MEFLIILGVVLVVGGLMWLCIEGEEVGGVLAVAGSAPP